MNTKALLDQLSTAVMLFDTHGRFAYLNQTAESALRTTSKVLLGQRYSFFIASDSLPLRELLKTLKDNGSFAQDDLRLELLNGRNIIANFTGHWIHLDKPYLMVEWQDRQSIKRYQHELGILQQNQINNKLLAQLAHEVKNPLSGIAGAAQLLALELADEQKEFTDIIQHEIERLSKLVDRMLLGGKKASKVLINIHEITEQVYDFCSINLPENIQLKKDYDPSLPDLTIAPESVYQALLNVVQNAIEACATQEQANIVIKTRALPRHSIGIKQYPLTLRIDVIDDGPGIDPALQPNVFVPLISGKQSSGLGLGIAQSLVQQQSGIIEFISDASGTTFSIYLPVVNHDSEVKQQ